VRDNSVRGRINRKKNCKCSDSGLTEKNCQHGVVCALRIQEATSFSLEEDVFIPDRGGRVDVDKCRFLTVRFESANPCNHRDRIQVVKIGVLMG